MKICFIITGLSVGGAEMMLYKLLKESPRLRSSIVISLAPPGPIAKRIQESGVRVFSLYMRRGLPSLTAFIRLFALLRRENADLISTWMYHADFLGGLAAKMLGIPVIWNIRNSTLDPQSTKFSTRFLVQICARISQYIPTRILSCSYTARDLHISYGYAPQKFLCIPNGFDLRKFTPDIEARTSVRSELHIAPNAPLVGLIARFDPQKNHRGFFEAARMLLLQKPETQFLLAGTGISPDTPQITSQLAQYGLTQHTHLLGPRTDIPRLMAALDIFVSASSYGEAFPNVLGEAMACGIPCAATDVGDSAYILGDTGLLVPKDDMQALGQAMLELLNLPPQERLQRGAKTRQRVTELFTIEAVAHSYETLFQKVCDSCVA